MIQAEVGSEIRLRSPPEELVRALEHELARPVRRWRNRKWGSEVVSLLRSEGEDLVVPRGAVGLVQHLAGPGALSWRSSVPVPAVAPVWPAVELRQYQETSAVELIRRVQAVVDLPCGGGKTTIGAAALLRLGATACVVVPTRDLVEQWAETLVRFGARRVYALGTHRIPEVLAPGEIVILIPSGARDPQVLARVLSQCGALLIDEVHRVPAAVYTRILALCPARYRWGLTATAERADGLGWTIPHLIGPVFAPATTQELIDAGWLVKPRIVPVLSPYVLGDSLRGFVLRCDAEGCEREMVAPHARAIGKGGKPLVIQCKRRRPEGACQGRMQLTGARGPLEWARAASEIAGSPEREELILRLAAAAARKQRTTLILVGEVAQAGRIADRLTLLGHAAFPLTGKESKRVRRSILIAFRRRQIRTVVATSLADEGLDVPAIDCAILGAPGKAAGKGKQRVGRTMRPSDGPVPVVFDLVDGSDELLRHWAERRRGYAKTLGWDAIVSRTPLTEVEAVWYLCDVEPEPTLALG